jgi:hypothetical protein
MRAQPPLTPEMLALRDAGTTPESAGMAPGWMPAAAAASVDRAATAARAAGVRPAVPARTGAAPDDAPDAGLGTRIARAALHRRHTALGRALYRLTPSRLVDLLKAKLR